MPVLKRPLARASSAERERRPGEVDHRPNFATTGRKALFLEGHFATDVVFNFAYAIETFNLVA